MAAEGAGLLVGLGGDRGEFCTALDEHEFERAERVVGALRAGIEPERLFAELPTGDRELAKWTERAAAALGILAVVVPEVCCAHPAEDAAFRFWAGEGCWGGTFGSLLRPMPERRHLAARALVCERWGAFPRALEATAVLAAHCARFHLPKVERRFPQGNFGRGVNAESYIWNTAFSRANERYGDLPTRYKERLNREFQEIVEAGLANALTALVRLHEEMEREGVQRGPGAGIFTNSLVASLLGLTRLDPIRFNLSFELANQGGEGAFPLLELNIPENQEEGATAALGRIFDGQVARVGEWKPWRAAACLERAAELLGRSARWITDTSRSAVYTEARDAALARTAADDPPASAPLDDPHVLAWLIRHLEGRHRELAVRRGVYAFSPDRLVEVLPLRHEPAALPLCEWPDGDLSRLRHGRIAFRHAPLLDLVGRATSIVREQADPHFAPERTPPDDGPTYRLLRAGDTGGIAPLDRPLLRRRLRNGQPGDLHTLIKQLQADGPDIPAADAPDLGTLFLSHVAAAIKARHPRAFFAAALSHAGREAARLGPLLHEIARRRLPLLPLDANYSDWDWIVEGDALRIGLRIVHGVTPAAGRELLRRRQEMHFANFDDFLRRTDRRHLKGPQIRALVHAGAFDSIDSRREVLLAALEDPATTSAGLATNALFGGGGAAAPPPTAPEAFPVALPLVSAALQDFLRRARVTTPDSWQVTAAGTRATLMGLRGDIQPDPVTPGALLAEVGGCLVTARHEAAEALAGEGTAGRALLVTGAIVREGEHWRVEAARVTTAEMAGERARQAEALQLDLAHASREDCKSIYTLLRRFPGPTPVRMEWLPDRAPRHLRRIAQARVLICPLLEVELAERLHRERWSVVLRDPEVPAAAPQRESSWRVLLPRWARGEPAQR